MNNKYTSHPTLLADLRDNLHTVPYCKYNPSLKKDDDGVESQNFRLGRYDASKNISANDLVTHLTTFFTLRIAGKEKPRYEEFNVSAILTDKDDKYYIRIYLKQAAQ